MLILPSYLNFRSEVPQPVVVEKLLEQAELPILHLNYMGKDLKYTRVREVII